MFVQCNVAVCGDMLAWANGHAECAPGALLFEPYCGNGNFTLPLSKHFSRVFGSDTSVAAVAAARVCADKIGASNIRFAVASAADVCHRGTAQLSRIAAAYTDEASRGSETGRQGQLRVGGTTVLLNPPREGACPTVLEACVHAEHIVYVSCNPETLRRDLLALAPSHRVHDAALFDQFPYSSHAEVGVALTRRKPRFSFERRRR
jgi:tRNA (uracil-5-)-methyltransferase